MAEVASKEVKVGETYRVRLGRGLYGTARVDAIQTDAIRPNVITGFRVTWLDADRPRKVVNPATLETV